MRASLPWVAWIAEVDRHVCRHHEGFVRRELLLGATECTLLQRLKLQAPYMFRYTEHCSEKLAVFESTNYGAFVCILRRKHLVPQGSHRYNVAPKRIVV